MNTNEKVNEIKEKVNNFKDKFNIKLEDINIKLNEIKQQNWQHDMTILATSSEKVVEIKYFAHNKSSRGKRTLEFNGSMIISKEMERKEWREKPKGKAKKEGKRRRRNHQEEKGQRV